MKRCNMWCEPHIMEMPTPSSTRDIKTPPPNTKNTTIRTKTKINTTRRTSCKQEQNGKTWQNNSTTRTMENYGKLEIARSPSRQRKEKQWNKTCRTHQDATEASTRFENAPNVETSESALVTTNAKQRFLLLVYQRRPRASLVQRTVPSFPDTIDESSDWLAELVWRGTPKGVALSKCSLGPEGSSYRWIHMSCFWYTMLWSLRHCVTNFYAAPCVDHESPIPFRSCAFSSPVHLLRIVCSPKDVWHHG